MKQLKKTIDLIPIYMRWKLYLIIFFIILSGLIELISIGLIFPFLSIILDPKEINFLGFSMNFENILSDYNIYEVIFYILVIFNCVIIFKNLFIYFTHYLKIRFFVNLKTDLCSSMYKRYMSKDLPFHIENDSSFLLRNIYSETGLFIKKILTTIIDIFQNIIIFTGFLVILLNLRFYETSIVIITLSSIGLIYYIFFKKTFERLGQKRVFFDGLVLKHIKQSLDGYREIIVYNSQNFFKNNLLKKIYNRETLGKIISLITIAPKYLFETIIILLITFVGLYIFSNEPNIKQIIPEIALLLAIIFRLLPLINKLIISFQTLKFSYPTLEILHNELCNEERENIEPRTISSAKLDNFKNEINFENISFKYPKSKEYIFKNLNVKFKKGHSYAIVGSSGSGKSTLLDLIAGFIHPSDGSILIDSENLKNFSKWKKKISYVSQNIFLTDDTIKNNIIFGNEQNFDQKLFEKSLNISNSLEFIDNLEHGANTIVGEHGFQFSGGQRQRINIARAIYKNPEIIILDEATSALDEANEEKIINSLINLNHEVTLFIATHRKSIIKKCESSIEIVNKKIIFND